MQMFISNANVHLQRRTHSSPAWNRFVSGGNGVPHQNKTRSSLSNKRVRLQCDIVFLVASDERIDLLCDIVFEEVNSRDYLIASDKHVHVKRDIIDMKRVTCIFESWFRNPDKEQKLVEKVSKRTSFQAGMDL